MNWDSVREGELKEVFDALEEAFNATGIDYYIIGAVAKDVWYARGKKPMRGTKDVDLAVLVGSQANYDAVKNYLKEHKNYRAIQGNSFVMLTPKDVQIDILPFGEIEIDEAVHIAGEGLSEIKVNGFMEVYRSGTTEVSLETGHRFKIATLPSIVLLKLIAFDDRPEKRSKDARDIAGIIINFFDLQADLIYEDHNDLFKDDTDDVTLPEIAATVIGREIKNMCVGNDILIARVKKILQAHVALEDESPFVENMVAENKESVEMNLRFLKNMLLPFIEGASGY